MHLQKIAVLPSQLTKIFYWNFFHVILGLVSVVCKIFEFIRNLSRLVIFIL